MVPYPRRLATMLSEGLFAAYTYTFGTPPISASDQLSAVLPSGEPGSHSAVPCMPMCTYASAPQARSMNM